MSNVMQPRDKIIPWYFVMFFIVIALVNAVMVTLAIYTHTGSVTEHPYEKGLAYNQVVEAERQQAALGWSSKITYAGGVLGFSLYQKHGQVIVPEKATAIFMRPTQAGMDFTVELKGVKTPIVFPVKGLWEVRINVVYKGIHYQQSKRIVVE